MLVCLSIYLLCLYASFFEISIKKTILMAVTLCPPKQTLVVSQRTGGGGWSARPAPPPSRQGGSWICGGGLGAGSAGRRPRDSPRFDSGRFPLCPLLCGTLAHGPHPAFAQGILPRVPHYLFTLVCTLPARLDAPCISETLQWAGSHDPAVQVPRLLRAFCGLRTSPVGPAGGPQCGPLTP